MEERAIIHINVADFAVAVERAVDSRLRDRPVIVAPEGARRAAVFDMSEEAFQNGVRKGMALRRALRYCRDAVVLPPHPDRYERAMTALIKHTLPYSPLVEMTDHNGHLFIDATGTTRLFGPTPDVAARIRRTVRIDLGFDPIWSVAPNKLIAKVASRTVKPNGERIVRPGEESTFLKPLPLYLIPGIETEDLKQLAGFNFSCAGHVSRLTLDQLEVVFGPRSRSLHDAARGIDPSPVAPAGRQPPRVSFAHAFGNDTNDVARIEGALYRLVEQAGAELRARRLAARRIGIFIDYSDGGRIVRQAPARPATANDFRLFSAARLALQRAWTRRIRIRTLRLACDRLTFPPAQRPLFPEEDDRRRQQDRLVATMDAVRQKFGPKAIQVGRTLAA